jgi:poly(3-hydroxyalkanoate) synthetase
MVNPPTPNTRASFRVAGENPPEAQAWLERASTQTGSWWPDYSAWLAERSGELKAAPARLGSRARKPTAKAPGSYVHAN